MKPDNLQGFWETTSNRPGVMDYLHLTPDGFMLNFVAPPYGRDDRWDSLWHTCRWNEHDELVIRYRDRAVNEMELIVQQPDADTLLFYHAKRMPREWRYTRVSWTTMPRGLEKAYDEGLRQIAKHQAEKMPFA
ncbi:MAG: hypothetical protein ACO1TE_24635 [Prosthecobacter sp.]